MYSNEYAEYIIKFQMDKRHHDVALKIINLVPENGILELSVNEIASRINKSETEVSNTLDVMRLHKNPLVKYGDNSYVFDYPEDGVEYVEHLSKGMSNMGSDI